MDILSWTVFYLPCMSRCMMGFCDDVYDEAKRYNTQRIGGRSRLKTARIIVKINRISAWMLLILMIIFLVSGYAWSNRTIMSLQLARNMHTQLDLFLVFFFLVHALISIRLTLARWRVGHGQVVNALLATIGVISFWLVLSIR